MGTTYTARDVCRLAGMSYRVLDYWARIGVMRPSEREARGSGSQRRYSAADLRMVRVLDVLRQMGAATIVLSAVASGPAQRYSLDYGLLLVSPTGEVDVVPPGSVSTPWACCWTVDLALVNGDVPVLASA